MENATHDKDCICSRREDERESSDAGATDGLMPVVQRRLVLPFDLALTRWSVMCIVWRDLANDHPNLTAFLAGWGCRCIGASQPENLGDFRDSFRVGWREADQQIEITSRQNADVVAPPPQGSDSK